MYRATRNKQGSTIVLLCFLLSFIIIGMLGVVTFEISRGITAHDELRTACEFAALSGAATLASRDDPDPTSAHQHARQAAKDTFDRNDVIGVPITPSTVAANDADNPPAFSTSLFIEFLDPNSTPPNQPITTDADPNGRVVHAVAAFGLVPAFGKFLGLGNYDIRAGAYSQVPLLDLTIVFDSSGSMDDETPCTFIKRSWDPNAGGGQGQVKYEKTFARGNPPHPPYAEGRLRDVVQALPIGTNVNVMPPQELEYLSDTSSIGLPQGALYWNSALRSSGATDYGTPPGNHPNFDPNADNAPAPFSPATSCTDLVVNIDGREQFQGITLNGDGTPVGPVPVNPQPWRSGSSSGTSSNVYSFPNLATVAAAQRGNLDSQANFDNSLDSGDTTDFRGVSPKPGYQAAYWGAVKRLVRPMHAAQDATQLFATIMHNNTNVHLSLVNFNSHGYVDLTGPNATSPRVGEDSFYDTYDHLGNLTYHPLDQGGYQPRMLDSSQWPYDPAARFPSPGVPLAQDSANYSEVLTALPQIRARGATNLDAALQAALDQLTDPDKTRANAKKVIVGLTDGFPTMSDNPRLAARPDNPDQLHAVLQAALDRARNAHTHNIPIYMIGMCQTSAIIPQMIDALNAGAGNPVAYVDEQGNQQSYTPSSDGVVAVAGNNGKFFVLTNVDNLRYVFENIARDLVQSVRVAVHGS
jgi:hypothetical protein